MTYVNREQSPKKTTSRLSEGRIDMAFENQPRLSAFEFVSGSFRVTFLNGKHTGNAGVIEMPGPSAERVRVTSLERTFIDCVVRPQYAGGIPEVSICLPQSNDSRKLSAGGQGDSRLGRGDTDWTARYIAYGRSRYMDRQEIEDVLRREKDKVAIGALLENPWQGSIARELHDAIGDIQEQPFPADGPGLIEAD